MSYLIMEACGPIDLIQLNMKRLFETIKAEVQDLKKKNILQLLLIDLIDIPEVSPIQDIESSFINHSMIIRLVLL